MKKEFPVTLIPSEQIVDLNGARDPKSRQKKLLEPILKDSGLKIQIGGGVRSLEDAEQLISWGADRVVLGSAAVLNPELVESILETIGASKVTLAVDVVIGTDNVPRAAIKGWQKKTNTTLSSIIRRFQIKGLRHVLCTDISRDGVAAGPNTELYAELVKIFPSIHFQASGGVRHIEDIAKLKEARVSGVIIGTALYEKTLDLSQALALC
jgi:phosphoribosylformimino-5-aminoimidazole carboxamide ribotide isomerase